MARALHARDRARASCAWPAAWRSTASPTGASCARRRSRSCSSSRRPATAAARSARRSTPTTACSASRAVSAWTTPTGARPTADGEIDDFLRGARHRAHALYATRTSCSTASSSTCSRATSIGWFQGRFEWGPRALGARSIIADPRRADMKDIVNTKIKFREPFRPFAPSVLVEAAERYFDLPDAGAALPGALHALRGRRQARAGRGAAGDHARRRHGAPADRAPPSESPLYYRLIERFGAGDRRAGGPQHLVQSEGRADRHHSGAGAQHVHAQRHGRAGARQLRSSPRR